MRRQILTINGGSSSVKFARYDCDGETLSQAQRGNHDRIDPANPAKAIDAFFAEVRDQTDAASLIGVGHRIVHGGTSLTSHAVATAESVAQLRTNIPLDRAHLPLEIALIEGAQKHFAGVPQVMCFDTAFFRQLPRVATIVPLPNSAIGDVRRLGFHGLSYTFLMSELQRLGEAGGRAILAHLGSGASIAAVRNGKPIDTSMGFTPLAGLVMGTRPGDLDAGVLVHLLRDKHLPADELETMLARQSGLLAVSGSSADMRDLLAKRANDSRAAEAVDLFCYQLRKFIGAYAAALGGVDTIVFAGGIGEHSPQIREETLRGLEFLGVKIDPVRNAGNEAIISADASAVRARVIRTDEEIVIARIVREVAARM